MARNSQLDKHALQLAAHFDFDFLKTYSGTILKIFKNVSTNLTDEKLTLLDLVQKNKPKNNQKQKKNLIAALMTTMKTYAEKTPAKLSVYETCLKKIENEKAEMENVEKEKKEKEKEKKEKEKEKEFVEMKKKVKSLEEANKILTNRLKAAETQITELYKIVQVRVHAGFGFQN